MGVNDFAQFTHRTLTYIFTYIYGICIFRPVKKYSEELAEATHTHILYVKGKARNQIGVIICSNGMRVTNTIVPTAHTIRQPQMGRDPTVYNG